jgi:hypothetical protein
MPAEMSNYMRVWKREGGAWRIVLDVTSRVRPRPERTIFVDTQKAGGL